MAPGAEPPISEPARAPEQDAAHAGPATFTPTHAGVVSSPGLVAALPSFSDERRSAIVLDLQQRIGNRAVTRLIEDQEPPVRDEVEEVEPAPPLAPGFDPDALADAVAKTIEAYRNRVNTAATALLERVLVPAARNNTVHDVWGPAALVVLNARLPADRSVRARVPPALAAPEALSAFGKVLPEDRRDLVDALFSTLQGIRDRAVDPAADASTAEAEWQQLQPVKNAFPKEGFDAYKLVRSNLLAAFGALDGGTAGALRRILDFYSAANMVSVELCGKTAIVHTRMATQIEAARTKFGKVPKSPAVASFQLREFGGLAIRPNKNNPDLLSEHAVGAAVDLDATWDPNEQDFPFDFIEDVTGEDLRAGATGKGVDLYNVTAAPGRPERKVPYKEGLSEADRFKEISEEFSGAFQSEAALGAQFVEIAGRHGSPAADAQSLLDAVIYAATEPGVRWSPATAPPQGGRAGKPRPGDAAARRAGREAVPRRPPGRRGRAGQDRRPDRAAQADVPPVQQHDRDRGPEARPR